MLDEAGASVAPPWSVEYGNTSADVWPVMLGDNVTKVEGKKLLGHCVPGCVDYEFDDSFWVSTMVTEWDLVCENTWLKTLAKLLLFTGFALGSFCSGLVSDRSVLSRIIRTISVVTNSIILPNTKFVTGTGGG